MTGRFFSSSCFILFLFVRPECRPAAIIPLSRELLLVVRIGGEIIDNLLFGVGDRFAQQVGQKLGLFFGWHRAEKIEHVRRQQRGAVTRDPFEVPAAESPTIDAVTDEHSSYSP